MTRGMKGEGGLRERGMEDEFEEEREMSKTRRTKGGMWIRL